MNTLDISKYQPSAPPLSSFANEIEGAPNVTEKVFNSILFMPNDTKENKEFWTRLSQLDLTEWFLDTSKDDSPLRPRGIVTIVILTICPPLIFMAPFLLYALTSYSKFKASKSVAYDNENSWKLMRAQARFMDFKTLVQTHGLQRVRNYALLADTPEQSSQFLREKFQEWMQRDDVMEAIASRLS